jgi:hypothetical protein
MTSPDFEKLAEQLAEIATSPNVEKTAGNDLSSFLGSDAGRYLIGGLGGAGAGALLGAAQPDKGKRRRNMMYYGALGGIGGLGLAHLTNSFAGGGAAANEPPAARAARVRQESAAAGNAELVNNFPTNSVASGAAGGVAGRYVGKPVSDALGAAKKPITRSLDAAENRARAALTAKQTAAVAGLDDPFKAKLLATQQQHAVDLADATAKAHAAQRLTGVPAQRAIDALTAQHKAQINGMQSAHSAARDAVQAPHAAAQARLGNQFKWRTRGNLGVLGLLQAAARIGAPVAGTVGGFHAPAALQQYISGE